MGRSSHAARLACLGIGLSPKRYQIARTVRHRIAEYLGKGKARPQVGGIVGVVDDYLVALVSVQLTPQHSHIVVVVEDIREGLVAGGDSIGDGSRELTENRLV